MNLKQYFACLGGQILFSEWKRTVEAEMNAAEALHKYNVSRKAGTADFGNRLKAPLFIILRLISN